VHTAVARGKMTFGDALAITSSNVRTIQTLNPEPKKYDAFRIKALLKSWPDLEKKDVGKFPLQSAGLE